ALSVHSAGMGRVPRRAASRRRRPRRSPSRVLRGASGVARCEAPSRLSSPPVLGSLVVQAKADPRAHAEGVAELDVEVAERLEPARVAERAAVDGVEADVLGQASNRAARVRVVARGEHGQPLIAEVSRVHVLSEDGVEALDDARTALLLLELLG